MNLKYFELPIEKRKNLINAGYKVFALHSYKKASMSTIAEAAKISKSLLFYYFKNKKEYYLFLFDTGIKFANEEKIKSFNEAKCDLFELIYATVERRMELIREYPYLYKFITKAYYEDFEEIKLDIDKRKTVILQLGKEELLKLIDRNKFIDSSDINALIDIILCIAEGCMRGCENLNQEIISKKIIDFQYMIKSLKIHYYKKEYLAEI